MSPPPKRNRAVLDLGPSSSGRWTVCTASPQFIVDNADKLPDDRTEYADEGTLAHSIAAQILLDQTTPPTATGEMLQHVQTYVDHVRSHITPGAVHKVEQRVSLFYLPHRNGVVDSFVWRPDGIYVDDLKYGVGVSVEATDNTQLAIYGESVIRSWEQIMDVPDELPVVLSIVQPRDRNSPVAVREWRLTRRLLREFTDEIDAKAKDILSGGGKFQPDPKACQFCPAKGFCSAYATQGLVALPQEARVIELPHPGALSREQRVRVLQAKKVLREWLNAVEDQEMRDLLSGEPPMGLKLVQGKSNRTWKDVEAAQKLLSNHLTMDELRPRSPLISPHAAEALLKGNDLSAKFRNKFNSLIFKPEGKPTLVSEDDPRPALDFKPESTLQNIDVI